jgi:hypothetical protein
MDADLRSMMVGPAPLYIIAGIALALTVLRRVDARQTDKCDRLIDFLLIGVAVQCLHFIEFTTGFHERPAATSRACTCPRWWEAWASHSHRNSGR